MKSSDKAVMAVIMECLALVCGYASDIASGWTFSLMLFVMGMLLLSGGVFMFVGSLKAD